MNNNIYSVFPKHIMIQDGICLEHIEKFKLRAEEIINEHGTASNDFLKVNSTHLTNSDLHKDPIFYPLVDEISKYVFDFMMFLGYDPERSFKVSLGDMWINSSDEGEYNWPHTHPGSLISGAYYIENQINSNNLTFFDSYIAVDFPINRTGEGHDRFTVPCIPGRLILFRSDFPHGALPQVGKGKKITVSFNLR